MVHKGEERRASRTNAADVAVQEEANRITRRSFMAAGIAVVAAGAGMVALMKSRSVGMLRRPLRGAEELNRALAEHVIGEESLAKTYPVAMALRRPRSNGLSGLRQDIDPASWKLQVTGLAETEKYPEFEKDLASWRYRYDPSFQTQAMALNGPGEGVVSAMGDAGSTIAGVVPETILEVPERLPSAAGLLLTMEHLRKLPFTEYAVEFKCIEGWSEVVHFGGVRFVDFMKAYPPALGVDGSLPKYVAMTTPDGSFFSGYEMAAMVHPQTLLCYQMSGKELTPVHGAPLRLACPLKYGYKQIKQIAQITYTNVQPHEYWAQFGYDWHGGL